MFPEITKINAQKKKNNIVILFTAIFHVPDFQVAVNIHWNEMVSKGKEQVNLNTVTIKGVNKLEREQNVM